MGGVGDWSRDKGEMEKKVERYKEAMLSSNMKKEKSKKRNSKDVQLRHQSDPDKKKQGKKRLLSGKRKPGRSPQNK